MKNKRYLYLIITAIHILLGIIAFKDFRMHPHDTIFCSYGDGLKNNFTLESYVKEPIGKDGIFKYNAMNYPFGEYVFYTDNTPFFSIPFRWFCHHVYDLSSYTSEFFQCFIISGILISGLLCFFVFRRLLKENMLSFILAVILPWINIQVMRIWRGHYNLSFSFLTLLAVALCIVWCSSQGKPRKRVLAVIGMFLLSYFSFFVHGYYLPIVAGFQALILIIYGLYRIKNKEGKSAVIVAAGVMLLAVGALLITLNVADGFYSLRKNLGNGYEWDPYKVKFFALFRSPDFYTIPFSVKTLQGATDAENIAFLGNCGCFALLFILVLMIVRKKNREQFHAIQKDFFSDPLKASIAIGGLVMLLISFGEKYYTSQDGFMFYNILNPFLYLHMLTDRVQQFRCVGRFAWPFFFSFYVWLAYTLLALTKTYTSKQKLAVIIGFTLFGGVEVKDYVDSFQGIESDNLLSQKHINEDYKQLKIDFSRYQAFVPLPLFMVGSETDSYTIDDNDVNTQRVFRFALHSHLPMMACKLSRTVPEQAHELLTLFANDSMSADIQKRLVNKPVLVYFDKQLVADSSQGNIPHRERAAAWDYYWKATAFAKRNQLNAIDSTGNIVFYEWNPKTMNSLR